MCYLNNIVIIQKKKKKERKSFSWEKQRISRKGLFIKRVICDGLMVETISGNHFSSHMLGFIFIARVENNFPNERLLYVALFLLT